MRRFKFALAAAMAAILAGGCGPILNPYHEDFHCKAPSGDGHCRDTPTAYRKAVSDPAWDFDRPVSPPGKDLKNPAGDPRREVEAGRDKLLAGLLAEPKAPLLLPPKVLRVLLLPYRGEDGELFMARYVYITLGDSRWVLTDVKEK